MRRIRIQHLTRYHYAETVTLLPHTLHLRPREGHDIRIHSSRLVIDPAYRIRWKRWHIRLQSQRLDMHFRQHRHRCRRER